MVKGGLLIAGVDAGGSLFQEVELAIEAGGRVLVGRAQVVQVLPGVGTAVTFTVASVAGLTELVAEARALGDRAWPSAPTATTAAPKKPAAAVMADKIQQALHGSRDERAAILRDTNPALHPYVLKNPNLQVDEVLAIARSATVSAEVYKQIADRREWGSRPDIALAMVRNPKVPVPIALRLLDHVGREDLRQLAKDHKTRGPIQAAARKRVITP